jgi:uncharacterized delta-60 repeat protein
MNNHRSLLATTIVLLFVWFVPLLKAGPGDLDTTFGGTGALRFGFGGGDDQGHAMAVQADGKIVVAGETKEESNFFHIAVVRHNTDGSLDQTFGSGGIVALAPYGMANALKIQPDGKIVVAGADGNGAIIARLNPDGSLDSSFGNGGQTYARLGNQSGGIAYALAIQSDKKIVVAGWGRFMGQIGADTAGGAVARLNEDGSTDSSFNRGGPVLAPLSQAYALAISGTTILVGGIGASGGQSGFSVVRYTASGSLDSTFNNGEGRVVTPVGAESAVTSLAIQPATSGGQNKIVAAGYSLNAADNKDFAIVRYNADDGSIDTSFDNDGVVTKDFGEEEVIRSVAIQNVGTAFNPSYRIVVGGEATTGTGFMVARYTSSGVPDNSFDGGFVQIPFHGAPESCQAIAISGSKIVAAGYTGGGNFQDYATARLNTDGSLDQTFNGAGKTFVDVGNTATAVAKGVAIQPDGKIVVAGYSVERSNNTFVAGRLARLNSDGSFDSTFGTGGKTHISPNTIFNAVATDSNGGIFVTGSQNGRLTCFAFGPGSSFVSSVIIGSSSTGNAVALQPDGKIIIAGAVDGADFAVVRYNLDVVLGPDHSFGNNGVVVTDFGTQSDVANSVAIQPDGKIVVAGRTADSFAVARYNPDGSPDTSFSGDGKVTTPANSIQGGFNEAKAVAIQADGKIIVTGDAGLFASVRYNPDGSLDGTFGDHGIARDSVGSNSGAEAVAIQTNGRIVVAGHGSGDLAVARYNANGSLDPSFSGDGKTLVDVSGAMDAAHAVAIDTSGRIVLAGEADGLFAITRLLGDTATNPSPTPTPGALGNISTRLPVLGGDNVLIAGMIATGNVPKKVMIRAIGPTLSDFGVPGALSDPTLELFQGNTSIASNDDWRVSSQEAEIEASGLAPGKNAEPAIIALLNPGQNYTAVARGKNGETGVALVEVYDLDPAAASRLGNISTRGFVSVDDNVMIAGIIVTPPDGSGAKILVRALGPTLADFGVPGTLANPTLDLVTASGTVIRSNDDWKTSQQSAIEAAGLGPAHDEEAALIETVPPGQYTAVVRGNNRGTGVGLVEVYSIP